jgi:uroporphyrinogen-III synthase
VSAGLLVVRSEPGNARTSGMLRAAGAAVLGWPLFVAAPVPWPVPDTSPHDALLVTSANAIRHAGPGLTQLAHLPVIAVGGETATLARAAGLTVAAVGDGGVTTALAAGLSIGLTRPLHLAGREHVASGHPAVIVYESADVAVDAAAFAAAAADRIVLLHSVRAAQRVATLVARRETVGIVALSEAVRDAAGPGWRHANAAAVPTDAALCSSALIAAGERAIDPAAGAGDKGP